MTNHQDDYLWDPSSQPDTEIARLEQLLKPLSASALNLANRKLPLPRMAHSPLRWKRWVSLAAAAMLAGIYFAHVYRLSWTDSSPWPVTVRDAGTAQSTLLRVGERISTTSAQTATLNAARIGEVIVAPNSVVQLSRTKKGQHRVELEHGRLHAKIWAPPNYFGVTHGDARFIDLGCEFDLNIEPTGNGTLAVTNGWVVYRHNNEELLVPESYSLSFDKSLANTPLRIDSAAEFRHLVTSLDNQLISNPLDQALITSLATQIANSARDSDYFTLLSLLYRHHQLAQGPLYPRLATALGAPHDEAHRLRWSQGDTDAINQWDQYLPKHPKKWWLNWRDAF